MIGKWLLQTLIWIALFSVLLFVPAGTWNWPGAWAFLGFMVTVGLACGWWLARNNPALLAERMRAPIQPDQPAADKKIIWAFGALNLIWFVAMGLGESFHSSRIPLALQVLGLALLIGCSAPIMPGFPENTFAAAIVRVQSDRGHHVISSGPYAFVRHPMYTAAVVFMI